MMTKKVQITGVLLVIAIIGVIVGVIITRQTISSVNKSSSAAGGANDSDSSPSSQNMLTKKNTTNSSSSGINSITLDPTSGKDLYVTLSCLGFRFTACCVILSHSQVYAYGLCHR